MVVVGELAAALAAPAPAPAEGVATTERVVVLKMVVVTTDAVGPLPRV